MTDQMSAAAAMSAAVKTDGQSSRTRSAEDRTAGKVSAEKLSAAASAPTSGIRYKSRIMR